MAKGTEVDNQKLLAKMKAEKKALTFKAQARIDLHAQRNQLEEDATEMLGKMVAPAQRNFANANANGFGNHNANGFGNNM